MAWAMGDKPPLQCFGLGRTAGAHRVGIWQHLRSFFDWVYEYPNGVRGYHNCRHWRGCAQRVKDYILGAKGSCDVFAPSISGENAWRYRGSKANMYQVEHDEMFAGIRSGNPINNGADAARSTLLAIMGRMAAYTGEVITWERALNSTEDLSPSEYAWADAPRRPVPRPGITKFV